MNYYEELGLSPEATAEQIHRAHRTLTKLMHPDVQTDDSVRRLAEMQMRRLNMIVATLTDDEKRKQYDKELKAPVERISASTYTLQMTDEEPPSPFRTFAVRAWKALPWWVWSSAGALILASAAVYFWADNLGSSFSSRSMAYVPANDTPLTAKSSPGSTGASSGPKTSNDLATRLRDAISKPDSRNDLQNNHAGEKSSSKGEKIAEPSPTRNDAVERAQTKPVQLPPPTSVQASNHTSITQPTVSGHQQTTEVARVAAPPVEQAEPVPQAAPSPATAAIEKAQRDSPGSPAPTSFALEGDWVYAPEKPEPRKPGLFPPAFIELKIYKASGELRGVYHARYEVEDHPVDPDVDFLLSGGDGEAKRFNWESPNGSKGTMSIKRLTDSTIKVEWETKVYSEQHVLTSGIATLSKR